MTFELDYFSVLLFLPLVSIALGWVLTFSRAPEPQVFLALRITEVLVASVLVIQTYAQAAVEVTFFKSLWFGLLPFELGLRGDELSSVMLLSVTVLSLSIFRYSISYLRGDRKQMEFLRNFQLTLFSISLLILSNNLMMFFIAWLGTSYGLHRLLLHYSDRPAAAIAAEKKWWVSRLGDACLLAAIALTFIFFGTLNFEELFVQARVPSFIAQLTHHNEFALVGLLFVIGAMTKSAQFPFHFWLPETMEAPTPVSALMHAGIINAGGFLVIRLSPILAHAPGAHALLVLVGGLTAVFGALVMMTQTDVKRYLAYSTISQLGFMMIECGLGLYTLALFHIVAHGLYKANAFLSTASVLHEPRPPRRSITWRGLVFSATVAIALMVTGLSLGEHPSAPFYLYLGVLALGLAQVIGSRSELAEALLKAPARSLGFLTVGVASYFAFEHYGREALRPLLPQGHTPDGMWTVSIVLLFALFIAGKYLSMRMQTLNDDWGRRLFIFFWNGAYVPHLTTKPFEKHFFTKHGVHHA